MTRRRRRQRNPRMGRRARGLSIGYVVALAGVAVVLYKVFGPKPAVQSNADFNAAQAGFLAY